MKAKNLVNQKFGHLTVLKRAKNNKHHKAMWLCLCECGLEKEILGVSLTSERTKSCGCGLNHKNGNLGKDITSQKFGRLTAIKRVGSSKKGVLWLCKCDCGGEKTATVGYLTAGSTGSCGCIQKGAGAIDLVNRRFGKLKVLHRVSNGHRGVRWLCECDCGKTIEVAGVALRNKEKKHCGCVGNWRLIDISGKRFGRLVVNKKVSRESDSRAFWECACDCGKTTIVSGKALRIGATVSCGCRMRETGKEGLIDLTGKVFTYLTVLKRAVPSRSKGNDTMWDVRCKCGSVKSVSAKSLSTGHTKSCGCWLGKHPEARSNYIGGSQYSGFERTRERTGFADEVRPLSENAKIAQVKCSVCNNWFTPTRDEVTRRIAALDGYGKGDGRYYCSTECKQACSVYGQKVWPKGFTPDSIRTQAIDPATNQLVLTRDNHKCQKCGSTENLNVHHIEGVAQNPMLANDINNCLTVCHDCHKEIHSQPGCTYYDYQRDACDNSEDITLETV